MIELKNFTEQDFEDFYRLIKEPTSKSAGIPSDYTREQAQNFFNQIVDSQWEQKILLDEKFVGVVFLNSRGQSDDLINTKELGITIDSQYQNQGIGTKVVALGIEYGRKNGLTEIWASTFKENIASKKILLNNGFEYKYEADMSILGLKNQEYYMKSLKQ